MNINSIKEDKGCSPRFSDKFVIISRKHEFIAFDSVETTLVLEFIAGSIQYI